MSLTKPPRAKALKERPLSAFAARKVLQQQNTQTVSRKEIPITTCASDVVTSPIFSKDAPRSTQNASRKRKRVTPSVSTDDPVRGSSPNVSCAHAESTVANDSVDTSSKRNLLSHIIGDSLPSTSLLLVDDDLDAHSSR